MVHLATQQTAYRVLMFIILQLFFCRVTSSNGIHSQQFIFQRFDVERGLPNSNVNCIYHDRYGYIWIGTEDGLARYDGIYFRVYNDNVHPRTIGYQAVISIFEDIDSTFLVGTRHTLELYDRERDAFFHFAFPPDPWGNQYFQVTAIARLARNRYLIGTDGGGMYEFTINRKSPDKSVVKKIKSHLYRISSIYSENPDTFWVTDFVEGLFRYVAGKGKCEKIDISSEKSLEIRSICGNQTHLFLGTNSHGLCMIDKKTLKSSFFTTSEGLPSNRIWAVAKDKQGNLWIGMDGGGIAYLQLKDKTIVRFQHYGFDQSTISNNNVHTLYVDRENNLWVGHFHGGISYANTSNVFQSLRCIPGYANTLSNKMVTAVLRDRRHYLWIGTDGGGINIYDSIWNRVEYKLLPASLIKILADKPILALYEDSESKIWIGTYLMGYFSYDPRTGQFRHFMHDSPSEMFSLSNDIRCFYEDKQSHLWVGTNGAGIYVINRHTGQIIEQIQKTLNTNNSLSLNWIRSIVPDSYGFIWIATSFGLSRYDPIKRQFVNYYANPTDTGALSDDLVLSIFEDKQRNLWIGTRNGLNLYNRTSDSFRKFYIQHGLPHNTINSILQDKEGNIWFATNFGLSCYDLANQKFFNYGRAEGLISSSFLENAAWYDSSYLYFGSLEGMVYFRPEKALENQRYVPIKITRIFLYNKEIEIGQKIDGKIILPKDLEFVDEIEFKYRHNVITIHYAPLSYSSRMYVFRYRLEGFNKDWVYANHGINPVTYTNLDPGKYRFRVQMLDKNNNPVSEASLRISVIPPFWMSFWFRLAVALLILFVIYSWYNQKLLKWEQQKAEFEKWMAEEQLKAEKARLKLQEEKLILEKSKQESMMAQKNSELTTFVLQLSHKNDILQKINHIIKQNAPLIQDTQAKRRIEEIGKILEKEFATEREWDRFEKHFNEVHADFIQRLKKMYPDMGLTYLKLCAYLKLDLSTKELAFLLNISPRGVEKARSRLRKRFNLQPGESLTEFLNKI
jgi:ligand-binding sensor domain-containing protein